MVHADLRRTSLFIKYHNIGDVFCQEGTLPVTYYAILPAVWQYGGLSPCSTFFDILPGIGPFGGKREVVLLCPIL